MLTGESAGTTFLNSPSKHLYYRAHSACGALVWTNTHPVTRGPKATAYEAAFGTGPQVVLGSRYPLDPDDERNQFMVPLWRLLSSADLSTTTLYVSLAYGRKIRDSPPGLHFALYHLADGNLLLTGANLTERQLAGELRIDVEALGVTGTGQVTELRRDLGAGGMMQQVPAGASTGTIAVAEMQPLEIRATAWSGGATTRCYEPLRAAAIAAVDARPEVVCPGRLVAGPPPGRFARLSPASPGAPL